MSKEKKLVKDIFIYGTGTFGARLISFLLLPFYTKIFTKGEYGFLDLVTTGSVLLVTIISLRLTDGIYRFTIDAQDNQAKVSAISSVANLILINLVLFILICWSVADVFKKIIPYASLFLVVFYISIRLIDECSMQLVRAIGKNTIYSISGILLAGSLLVLNFVFIGWFRLGVSGFLIAAILSYAISFGYKIVKTNLAQLYDPLKGRMAIIKPILAYSLPLLPAAISWWFMRLSGRYILSLYRGLDEVGIYAVADKIPSVMYIGSMIFYLAWQDSALGGATSQNDDSFFSKVFNKLLLTGASLVIICIVLLRPFFYIMVDPKYASAYAYVPYLLLSMLILSLAGFYEIVFQGAKETMSILYSALGGAALNIILNFILVPKMGIAATTLSTLIASILVLFLRIVWARKKIMIEVDKKLLIKLLIVFGLSIIIYNLNIVFYLVLTTGIIGYLVYINRISIKMMVGLLKAKEKRFS